MDDIKKNYAQKLQANFIHTHLKASSFQSILVWIQAWSNEGQRPFTRGFNYKIAKIYWRNLKIFFSKTTGPISTKQFIDMYQFKQFINLHNYITIVHSLSHCLPKKQQFVTFHDQTVWLAI